MARDTDLQPCATSEAGLLTELEKAQEALSQAQRAHDFDVAVLNGETLAKDGTARAGDPLTPGRARQGVLTRVLSRAMIAVALYLALPGLIEGNVVATNVRAYLRVDDADVFGPLVIAASAIIVLTLIPFLLGKRVNKVIHGRKLVLGEQIVYSAAAGFWLVGGVALAMVRVSVDRDSRVRQVAQDSGRTVQEIDPSQVFDPTLPTVFWIIVLLGLGVALITLELTDNPAQRGELRTRIALVDQEQKTRAIEEALAEVRGQIALAEHHLATTRAMWKKEFVAITARAERDKQVYRMELCLASGDPNLALALEHRDLRTRDEAEARAWTRGLDAPAGDVNGAHVSDPAKPPSP